MTRADLARGVVLTPVDGEAQWTTLFAAHPDATPFHSWRFLTLLSAAFRWRFIPLAVAVDRQAVGVVPVLLRPSVPVMGASPPFPYVGPLVPAAALPDTLRALRARQWRTGVARSWLSFSPSASDPARSAFATTGLVPREERTFVVDLSHGSLDALLAGYSRERRKHLRQSERRGVVLRAAGPGELQRLLPKLLEQSWRGRREAIGYPPGVGEAAEQLVRGTSAAFATTALVDGEPAGMSVRLNAGGTTYAWMIGAFPQFHSHQVSTALQHADLAASLAAGQTRYDLVGHVDQGVATFKRSFGATEQSYVQATSDLVPHRAVRLLVAGRDRLRRARRARSDEAERAA